MTLPPSTGDAVATSTVSFPVRGRIFVLPSITKVQSLPVASLMARLSAATVFTAPTAVIVVFDFSLMTLPPSTGDAGAGDTDSCAAARVMPADTSMAIAIAVIIPIRFIKNPPCP